MVDLEPIERREGLIATVLRTCKVVVGDAMDCGHMTSCCNRIGEELRALRSKTWPCLAENASILHEPDEVEGSHNRQFRVAAK